MKSAMLALTIFTGILMAGPVEAIQRYIQLPDAQVEEMMLKIVEDAEREGEILKIRTAAGIVTFEDRLNIGEGSAKYYLAGYTESRGSFFLVRVIGYESRGYVLVDKTTGRPVDLFGIPVFSPDGKRFVDVSLDLESGNMPNLIRIYKYEGKEYALEWEYTYQGMRGPSNPVWLDNSAIVFFEVRFDKFPAVPNLKKEPFMIERENDKWSVPRPLNSKNP